MQPSPSPDANYVVYPPRASLSGAVRCVWRHRSATTERRIERIPPDACPELIVNLGALYSELTATGDARLQPQALFAGQLTRPLTLVAAGPVDTIGVRFEPDGARGFYGEPMASATNRRIALADIRNFDAAALLKKLRPLAGLARVLAIEDFVATAMRSAPPRDPAVARAIRELTVGNAIVPDGLSTRQLQRRFIDRVGISMRDFQSILRFRRVFDEIEGKVQMRWVESALAAGYFDQAQMAKDFRRYLGCTASDWARQKIGLAALLARDASQTYKPAGGDGH